MPSSRHGARVLYHEYGAQLRLTTEGRYILNVLCGRVGQFGVEIELNSNEVLQYREQGDVFIHNLAEDVYDDPKRFRARILREV